MMRLVLVVLAFLLSAVPVYADEKKPPTCPEQLAQVSQHANNVLVERGKKEYEVAKLQVELQQWKQQAAGLQQQVDDLKKAHEKKPD